VISKILSFFGGLKITAILGGALAIALGWIKILGYQKKELEEENAAHEKKHEIIEDMHLAKVKARDKRDEALKDNDGSDYMDRL